MGDKSPDPMGDKSPDPIGDKSPGPVYWASCKGPSTNAPWSKQDRPPVTLPQPCDSNLASRPADAAPAASPHPRATLAAAIAGSSVAFIDGSVVNVARCWRWRHDHRHPVRGEPGGPAGQVHLQCRQPGGRGAEADGHAEEGHAVTEAALVWPGADGQSRQLPGKAPQPGRQPCRAAPGHAGRVRGRSADGRGRGCPARHAGRDGGRACAARSGGDARRFASPPCCWVHGPRLGPGARRGRTLRRHPSPGSWVPRDTADLLVLDKVNAKSTPLTLKVGQAADNASLSITLRACSVRPPDQQQDATAYLDIQGQPGKARPGSTAGCSSTSRP